MALLTPDERRTLNTSDKRQLRIRRRSARKVERQREIVERRKARQARGLPKIEIDWTALRASAEEHMVDLAEEMIPGEEKMRIVLERLVESLDKAIDFTGVPWVGVLLEQADGPILRAIVLGILEPMVQGWWEDLRQTGEA